MPPGASSACAASGDRHISAVPSAASERRQGRCEIREGEASGASRIGSASRPVSWGFVGMVECDHFARNLSMASVDIVRTNRARRTSALSPRYRAPGIHVSRPTVCRKSSKCRRFARMPIAGARVDRTCCAAKISFCINEISGISTCYSPGCEHFLWITRPHTGTLVHALHRASTGNQHDPARAQQMRAAFFRRPINNLSRLSASCPLACKQILWITIPLVIPHLALFCSTWHNFRARRFFPVESAACHAFPQVINGLVNKKCG